MGPDVSWNYGWDKTGASLGFGGNGQFTNFWNFGYNYTHEFESLDDRLTRGGVMAATPASNSGFVFLSTDARRAYTTRLVFSGSKSRAQDWRVSTNVGFGMRPGSNVEVQLGPNVTRSRTTAQYLTSISDALAPSTLGRRYVFGDFTQTSLSIETRLNVTFRPILSLELYAQPLLSSGGYSAIKELRAPRTFDFDVYGRDVGTVSKASGVYTIDPDGNAATPNSIQVDDPNFNFRSLRGNAVMRWEYRPGSALFFVWQQQRVGSEPFGDFDFSRDFRGLVRQHPDNVFTIKATYYLAY